MWRDVEAASFLNAKGLFKDVYYLQDVGNLKYCLRDRYFSAAMQSLNGLATIKYNPQYCQFLSEQTGINLFKGFASLEQSPLVLCTDIKAVSGMSCTSILWDEARICSYSINVDKDFLKKMPPIALETCISHELGHALIKGSRCSPDEAFNRMKPFNIPKRYFREAWDEEFNPDKIAIASNPDNNIGQALLYLDIENAWLNEKYQTNQISEKTANLMAKMCMMRDEIVGKACLKWNNRFDIPLNKLFRMNCSPTHPAPLARAVEAEKFAEKCKRFLGSDM